MAVRECPMCGDKMQLREHQITDRVPGTTQTRTSTVKEWMCPACDYFEEADEPSAGAD
jgi:C4-type Zn-finger protein